MSRTLQRFEGASIESALTEAVARLGPDVSITDARRVRSGGVLGFFAKERYEVLVEPGGITPSPELNAGTPHRGLDETLEALVARVEAEEDTPDFGAALAAAGNLRAGLNGVLGDDLPAPAMAPPLPEPVGDPAPEPVPEPAAWFLAEPEAAPAPLPGEPRWSEEALSDLGVPEAVRQRLAGAVPTGAGDAEWTAAMVAALADVLPGPVRDPAAGPAAGTAAVSGHGPESAAAIIRAALAGAAPGTLHLDRGPVPATPMELALAVRTCLPR